MESKIFPTHFIPEFQVHQLPCQGRIRNHETLPTATNNINSRQTQAENYLSKELGLHL